MDRYQNWDLMLRLIHKMVESRGQKIQRLTSIRSQPGVSKVAVLRDEKLFPNPATGFRFSEGDWIGTLCTPNQLNKYPGMSKLQLLELEKLENEEFSSLRCIVY